MKQGECRFWQTIKGSQIETPEGYYEFEAVKSLDRGMSLWLDAAKGKAIKIISGLITQLPIQYNYNILFMERDLKEVIASQQKMLVHRKEALDISHMEEVYKRHIKNVLCLLDSQTNMRVLVVNYNMLIKNPRSHLA